MLQLTLFQPSNLPKLQKLLKTQPQHLPQLRSPSLSNKVILGIDEVGRGPWAGPLVIGAVILGQPYPAWSKLTDSKKLSAKKREKLSPIILEHAIATGLGWVSADEIDRYGLSNSLRLATRRAIKPILHKQTPFDEIIIDGTNNFLIDTPLAARVTILKKADLLIPEVSAASIIAKVARDHYMIKLAQKYPQYGFEKHVGYGTAAHRQALDQYGICPEHRRSFRPIQALLTNPQPSNGHTEHTSNTNTNHTAIGTQAESLIANHLAQLGHAIIARNYRTKTFEIDLISTYQSSIYFTEVKYRRTATHGSSLSQITTTKLQQMQYAAQSFMHTHPEYQNLQPFLAAGAVTDVPTHILEWIPLVL